MGVYDATAYYCLARLASSLVVIQVILCFRVSQRFAQCVCVYVLLIHRHVGQLARREKTESDLYIPTLPAVDLLVLPGAPTPSHCPPDKHIFQKADVLTSERRAETRERQELHRWKLLRRELLASWTQGMTERDTSRQVQSSNAKACRRRQKTGL